MPGGQPWPSAVDDRRRGRSHAITGHQEDPCVVERFRWLVVAMGVARGTPGGLAIADIARLGYVVTRPPSFPATGWRLIRFDHPGVVHVGEPLPQQNRRWPAIESAALRMEIAALPRLQFVTAHETLRILSELRREGHSFEDAGTP